MGEIVRVLSIHCRDLMSIVLHEPLYNALVSKQDYVYFLTQYGHKMESVDALTHMPTSADSRTAWKSVLHCHELERILSSWLQRT